MITLVKRTVDLTGGCGLQRQNTFCTFNLLILFKLAPLVSISRLKLDKWYHRKYKNIFCYNYGWQNLLCEPCLCKLGKWQFVVFCAMSSGEKPHQIHMMQVEFLLGTNPNPNHCLCYRTGFLVRKSTAVLVICKDSLLRCTWTSMKCHMCRCGSIELQHVECAL